MTVPPHPHPELDDLMAKIDDLIPAEGESVPDEPEGQPTQTDNRPRPEDGDQSEVDQKILAPGGSPQ